MWDNPAKLGQPTHRTSQAALGRTSGVGQLASKWDDHSWDTPAELGQPAAKLGQPGRVGRPMQGWDDPVKWDSLPQGGMARSWDTPAKLGHPSQTGTTQPNWDSPAAWDVPHRVGRPNRLGCPMQMWDDSVVDHPHNLPGTHHTNWADPIFSRLLRPERWNRCESE